MIVVERFTVDRVLRMVHPYLADRRKFEQAFFDHRGVIAGEAGAIGAEEHLPAAVLDLAFFIGFGQQVCEGVALALELLGQVVAGHVIVAVVTVDGHQRVQIHLHAALVEAGFRHALIDVRLEVLHHVDRSDKIVRVECLQRLFQLRIADIGLVGVVRVGVFASVYGSIMLLPPEERKYVKGILINKFRGDLRLFEEGRKMLEDLCGIPVLGVVPYYHDIHIEEEDSVALAAKSAAAQRGKVNVAVVLLRHISNFTDFNALERDPRVHLFYTNNVEELAKADVIILPGSKSTIDDLYELRRNGVAQAILRARREGATVLGICGGYQMMGVRIRDPHHVEGDLEVLPGLGLLPMTTEMLGDKVTRQVRFQAFDGAGETMEGYEIHMGKTLPVDGSAFRPLTRLEDGQEDGCIVDEKCMGTYVHGILDNPAFIDRLLAPHAAKLTAAAASFDYRAFKEEQYDKLAAHVRKYVDIPLLYKILSEER